MQARTCEGGPVSPSAAPLAGPGGARDQSTTGPSRHSSSGPSRQWPQCPVPQRIVRSRDTLVRSGPVRSKTAMDQFTGGGPHHHLRAADERRSGGRIERHPLQQRGDDADVAGPRLVGPVDGHVHPSTARPRRTAAPLPRIRLAAHPLSECAPLALRWPPTVTSEGQREPRKITRKAESPGQIESDLGFTGAAFGIRTRDLRITSALLWPSELRRLACRTVVRSEASPSLHSFRGCSVRGRGRRGGRPGTVGWAAMSSAFRSRAGCRSGGSG